MGSKKHEFACISVAAVHTDTSSVRYGLPVNTREVGTRPPQKKNRKGTNRERGKGKETKKRKDGLRRNLLRYSIGSKTDTKSQNPVNSHA